MAWGHGMTLIQQESSQGPFACESRRNLENQKPGQSWDRPKHRSTHPRVLDSWVCRGHLFLRCPCVAHAAAERRSATAAARRAAAALCSENSGDQEHLEARIPRQHDWTAMGLSLAPLLLLMAACRVPRATSLAAGCTAKQQPESCSARGKGWSVLEGSWCLPPR